MLKQTRSSVFQGLTVAIMVSENVQVQREKHLGLNSETPALSSGHTMVKPCLNRETLALNSDPIRTHPKKMLFVASANTKGTLLQTVGPPIPRLVNLLGGGNHLLTTTGPSMIMLRRQRASSRRRLPW